MAQAEAYRSAAANAENQWYQRQNELSAQRQQAEQERRNNLTPEQREAEDARNASFKLFACGVVSVIVSFAIGVSLINTEHPAGIVFGVLFILAAVAIVFFMCYICSKS
mmetsp:Transcript_9404/g.35214  ORF Transcript_9404/g.35214 Transcript_9404/m.35214 type:complete len:109 (+) Transcript_9404:121-447(+)